MNKTTEPAINRLLNIMQQLRNPDSGCDWDKAQSFESILAYTLEETYEVIDAIQRQDFADLQAELGDLLFQIVFYAQLAKEQHYFDFAAVCESICEKLERRHPHIFGSADSKPNWEQLKQQERKQKAQMSLLDDIPSVLPALMQAYKIQKRCASVGFDWDSLAPVVGKVREELDEVLHEVELDQDPARVAEEIGDLLFACVNLSRHLGHNPELVLQQASQKFSRRFQQIEQHFAAQQRPLTQVSLAEMEQVWQQVKQQNSAD